MTLLVPGLISTGARGTTTPGIPSPTGAGQRIIVVVAGNITVSGGTPAIAGFSRTEMWSIGATGRYIAKFEKVISASEGTGTYTVTATNCTISFSQAWSFSNTAATGDTDQGKTNIASGSNAVIPAGNGTIVVGDLVIAAFTTTGATVTATPPSGWTEISTTTAALCHVFMQIADHTATDGDTFVSSGGLTGGLVAFASTPAADDGGGVTPPPTSASKYKASTAAVGAMTVKVKKSDGTVVDATVYHKKSDGTVVAV